MIIKTILECIENGDIPSDNSGLMEDIYSFHNKVCDAKEWYMHSRSSREQVLDNLKTWLESIEKLLNTNVRTMTKKEKLALLQANNMICNEKETTYSCAACRNRMVRRLNDYLKK